MAPASRTHITILGALQAAIRTHLADRRSPCTVMPTAGIGTRARANGLSLNSRSGCIKVVDTFRIRPQAAVECDKLTTSDFMRMHPIPEQVVDQDAAAVMT
jgi:hypothetical protein